MLPDILNFLADILRIDYQTLNQYSLYTPIEQMFYLFFFPTLFIIILIYILVHHYMSEHKGLSILLAGAVYAFIIFQGLYKWFIFLSKYWLIGLVILGLLWMFFRPRGGGTAAPQGGAKAKAVAGASGMTGTMKRALSFTKGEEQELIREIEANTRELEEMPIDSGSLTNQISLISEQLDLLGKLVRGSMFGFAWGPAAKKYRELRKKFQKVRGAKEK